MNVKNNDNMSVQISGEVNILYNWNLNIVNIGMLANRYAGLKRNPVMKEITVAFSTYRVIRGVSRR